MFFVDTNIFIRYFTADDPQKEKASFHLFEKARNNTITLTTSESILAEVVFVLSSRNLYNVSRTEIHTLLSGILALSGLRLPHRAQYQRALDLYVSYPLDFEDALMVAQMERQKVKVVYSYDQDFDRIESVKRIEP